MDRIRNICRAHIVFGVLLFSIRFRSSSAFVVVPSQEQAHNTRCRHRGCLEAEPSPSSSPPHATSRRAWLLGSAVVLSTISEHSSAARAYGEGEQRMVFKEKPTAPVEALLPAVQQRLLLEACIQLARDRDYESLRKILPPLDDDDKDDGGRALLWKRNPSGSLNRSILQRHSPARVLRGDVVRAAMNLYQTNLNYDNLFVRGRSNPNDALTITDTAWKKSYIRANDGLPDDFLSKVIGADLDMRQLLRNQVQEKIDDAAAELYYRDSDNGSNGDDNDPEELVALLREAAGNFDQWLDRVRTGDVRIALEKAMNGASVQVYDTYAAGFLPPAAPSPSL